MDEPKRDLILLNTMNAPEAAHEFLKCCGSLQWANRMVESRPFESIESLKHRAAQIWWDLKPDDWLEAFRSHPKIGETKAAKDVSRQAQKWSGQEQGGVQNSPQEILNELAKLNQKYESKFGYIFIVCATGKSPAEMLGILKSRIGNDSETELPIAAGEQAKITEIRLRKLLEF
ncbi:MAG TPA: 2-oxo-4-hydroxy-4-carboxy-5-ureidoimidazoline decarboxylase [Pyrinomonadaceae bacterium]|jgi:OHCU decarboxylase|nr:2-oxo-4-hydroxy-4-carboxy-5-ureidoimidazoline decarboxylase [Pyrinomonadaceae bacterium]